jgi:hypothetical protein
MKRTSTLHMHCSEFTTGPFYRCSQQGPLLQHLLLLRSCSPLKTAAASAAAQTVFTIPARCTVLLPGAATIGTPAAAPAAADSSWCASHPLHLVPGGVGLNHLWGVLLGDLRSHDRCRRGGGADSGVQALCLCSHNRCRGAGGGGVAESRVQALCLCSHNRRRGRGGKGVCVCVCVGGRGCPMWCGCETCVWNPRGNVRRCCWYCGLKHLGETMVCTSGTNGCSCWCAPS